MTQAKNAFATFCFLAVASIAACTLTPKDTGKAYMFALSPAPVASATAPAETRLVVSLPATSPELDTYRVALTRDGGVRDYYAGARWADFLPVLVQDNIVKTLERADLFKIVAADQTALEGDFSLKIEIRDFQAEYAAKDAPPTIKLRLVVSLLDRLDRRVIAKMDASSHGMKAQSNTLPAIRAAFEKAFDQCQRQLVEKLKSEMLPKN